MGAETFYKYCEGFGFLNLSSDPDANLTAKTGIDLAGESGSIWWSQNTFCSPKNLSQLAAASFGQTFTITPLQLITAVSACVNGGRLMKPYVVRRMLNSDGSLAYEREPTLVRQVISEETSAKVRSILERVVGDDKDGTGRNAAVPGYRIGGKTGTSEKVSLEAQTGEKEYIVSFIGFAPAEDPQIAVLVFLDTPSNKSGIYISGGQMAAPVVGNMMADILPYIGVEAQYSEEERAKMDVAAPQLVGLSKAELTAELQNAGLRYRSIGEGETVTAQLPEAGCSIAAGSEIIVYFDREPSADLETMAAGVVAGAVTGILHTVFEIPAILAGILTQISLWSINLRIMGGKSNLPLLKVKTLISGLAASFGMTQAQASMIVGIVLAVAAILFLYWFFGTEIGSAMRATGNNEDMVRALGVDTRMTKLLSLMVSNGLVGLSGALVCQSQKYGDVGSGTGAIVIGLAAIVIGEVLMGRLTSFYWKMTSVVVGSVIYFVIRAVVLRMGMDANDMKLLSAVIVALALCIPVALAKYRLRKDYSEGGEE